MAPICFVLSLFLLTSLSGIAGAAEIAVLKSAGLPYYEQAVVGFKAGIPATTSVKEYNLNGQLAEGRQIAKSLRASPPRSDLRRRAKGCHGRQAGSFRPAGSVLHGAQPGSTWAPCP